MIKELNTVLKLKILSEYYMNLLFLEHNNAHAHAHKHKTLMPWLMRDM